MQAAKEHHPPYLLIGFLLVLLTIFEVLAVQVSQLQSFSTYLLIIFGGGKALLIASYFMHLKFDRRLYTLLFGIGAVEGVLMVAVLVNLIFSHPSVP